MTHYTRNPQTDLPGGLTLDDDNHYVKETVDTGTVSLVGARPWDAEGFVFVGDESAFEAQFSAVLESEDFHNVTPTSVILQSPNGSNFQLAVTDDGTAVVTPI